MKNPEQPAFDDATMSEDSIASRLIDTLFVKGMLTEADVEDIRNRLVPSVRREGPRLATVDAAPPRTLRSAENVCDGKSDRGHRRSVKTSAHSPRGISDTKKN
jgi:hypothetical protein